MCTCPCLTGRSSCGGKKKKASLYADYLKGSSWARCCPSLFQLYLGQLTSSAGCKDAGLSQGNGIAKTQWANSLSRICMASARDALCSGFSFLPGKRINKYKSRLTKLSYPSVIHLHFPEKKYNFSDHRRTATTNHKATTTSDIQQYRCATNHLKLDIAVSQLTRAEQLEPRQWSEPGGRALLLLGCLPASWAWLSRGCRAAAGSCMMQATHSWMAAAASLDRACTDARTCSIRSFCYQQPSAAHASSFNQCSKEKPFSSCLTPPRKGRWEQTC